MLLVASRPSTYLHDPLSLTFVTARKIVGDAKNRNKVGMQSLFYPVLLLPFTIEWREI